jgi:hypothetical protein
MKKSMAFAVLAILGSAPILANDSTPNLDKREAHQHARVHQGVESGSLTKPEARRLREGEARLKYNEAKAKADGTVTSEERAKLQREADRESERIYRQKHDPQTRN